MLQARWRKETPGNEQSYQSFTKTLPNYPLLEAPPTGWQARECHHQGIVPPGGENIPDHTQPRRACHPPCHWGCLGQRGSGYLAAVLWLYRQQYQGKTHEFGIYCAYSDKLQLQLKSSEVANFWKRKHAWSFDQACFCIKKTSGSFLPEEV